MDKKNKSTRKDVANLACVSETIVSYVINNNRYVSKDKRERVLNAIKVLNYKPNHLARALKGKGTNLILFIADKISTEHFGILVEEIDKVAYNYGYLISLIANRNDSDFISRVISRQPDGIIISSVSFEEKYLKQLINSDIPVVLLGNRIYKNLDNRIGLIIPGIYNGMVESINYLIQKNCKNIIYIDRVSNSDNFSDLSDLRYSAFCKTMGESNLLFSSENIFTGYSTEEELSVSLKHYLNNNIVDGVIARNDNLAAIAINVIKEHGLHIPQDVSIIGFDNSRLSQFTNPKLTTVEINRKELAKSIMEAINDMINGDLPEIKEFKTKLIIRETT